MKWINHQIVTGFIVCTATDDAQSGRLAAQRKFGLLEMAQEASHVVTLSADLFCADYRRAICQRILSRTDFKLCAKFDNLCIGRSTFAHCRRRNLRQDSNFHAEQKIRNKTFQGRLMARIFFRRADNRDLSVRAFREC